MREFFKYLTILLSVCFEKSSDEVKNFFLGSQALRNVCLTILEPLTNCLEDLDRSTSCREYINLFS